MLKPATNGAIGVYALFVESGRLNRLRSISSSFEHLFVAIAGLLWKAYSMDSPIL